jgi:hypothetical protein
MSDFAIAGMLLTFLVALAVAAQIWGVDSRDGVASDQAARRVAWLQGGASYGRVSSGYTVRTAGLTMASVLRSAAHRIDADAGYSADLDRQAVPA